MGQEKSPSIKHGTEVEYRVGENPNKEKADQLFAVEVTGLNGAEFPEFVKKPTVRKERKKSADSAAEAAASTEETTKKEKKHWGKKGEKKSADSATEATAFTEEKTTKKNAAATA